MLEELRFVTVSRGKPVPAGRKSVTLRLVFRDPQRTLRHEEVDPQVATVLSRLTEDLGAELRK
jgi:phenylalanyl-tRNA synthetase beta chain